MGSWGQLGGLPSGSALVKVDTGWCGDGIGGRYKEKRKVAIKTTEPHVSDEAGE